MAAEFAGLSRSGPGATGTGGAEVAGGLMRLDPVDGRGQQVKITGVSVRHNGSGRVSA